MQPVSQEHYTLIPMSEEQQDHGFCPLVVTVSPLARTRPLASGIQGLDLNSGHWLSATGFTLGLY